MRRMSRLATGSAVLAVLPALLCVAWFAGCGAGGGKPAPATPDVASAGDRMFERIGGEYSRERDEQVVDLVRDFAAEHRGHPREREVLDLGIAAARRSADTTAALEFVDARLRLSPPGAEAAALLQQAAGVAADAGDTLRAADYLVQARAAQPDATPDPALVAHTAALVAALDENDLDLLMDRHRANPLRPYLGYVRTCQLVRDGRAAEARAVVVDLESSAPRDRWTGEARVVLEDPRAAMRALRPLGPGEVQPRLIGVLCPLTGRYAMLGNAFVDAALLAVDAAARETGVTYELKIEDTAGDPVPAALAARRLCTEDGCIALLGAMMSAPTAAVALVADQWGVPVVSPTATSDRVWELGPGVFQPNLTEFYEARIMAELGVRVLLKRRFAILHPDSPEGLRQAELFQGEVESWGGEIVAVQPFSERATDFRAPILAVRETRPEVIFVPASVDQMALLGPQLDFHRTGALVMGLSNFKSERLVERTGAVLEGVMFPDDVALFPPAWTAEFNEAWSDDNYPREATTLALKTYQATRMLLDTLHQSGAVDRAHLTGALQRRLSARDVDTDGPESFASTVRIIRDGRFAYFPAELYTESWALTEGVADSLQAAPADSLSGSAGRE